MLRTVVAMPVPYIAMHWRGHSNRMADFSRYADVVTEVVTELGERLADAVAAGIAAERVVLDPGLGFAKESAHNWALLHDFDRLLGLGRPVLVGASRKRFLGTLLADDAGPRSLSGRDDATSAVSALAAFAGAWCVRVHDVRASRDAVEVAHGWARG